MSRPRTCSPDLERIVLTRRCHRGAMRVASIRYAADELLPLDVSVVKVRGNLRDISSVFVHVNGDWIECSAIDLPKWSVFTPEEFASFWKRLLCAMRCSRPQEHEPDRDPDPSAPSSGTHS